MTAEWKWDLAHKHSHQGTMESERRGPMMVGGRGNQEEFYILRKRRKAQPGGPPVLQK